MSTASIGAAGLDVASAAFAIEAEAVKDDATEAHVQKQVGRAESQARVRQLEAARQDQLTATKISFYVGLASGACQAGAGALKQIEWKKTASALGALGKVAEPFGQLAGYWQARKALHERIGEAHQHGREDANQSASEALAQKGRLLGSMREVADLAHQSQIATMKA